MISAKGIKKSFGNFPVLNGTDLEIKKGEVVAIMGPSGSGKTTFLRILNFLESADEGIFTFDEKEYDLKTITKKEIDAIRKKTAFVFQSFNLWNNKTALENVMLSLTVARKIEKKEAKRLSVEALEKVNMADFANFFPFQLSGGQQQRVAIARAIVTKPEIVYFDEPTSALDVDLTGEVLDVMKKMADEGMTMVVVTHEVSFARGVADRVMTMEKGILKEMPRGFEPATPPLETSLRSLRENGANVFVMSSGVETSMQ